MKIYETNNFEFYNINQTQSINPKILFVINSNIDNDKRIKKYLQSVRVSYDPERLNNDDNQIFNIVSKIHGKQINRFINTLICPTEPTEDISQIDINTIKKYNDIEYVTSNLNFAYHYFIDRKGTIYKGRPYNVPCFNLDMCSTFTDENNKSQCYYTLSNDNVLSNSIVILTEENTSNMDCTNETYVALKSLIDYIYKECSLINTYYCYSEVKRLPEEYYGYNNPGFFFKFNELRASVTNVLVDTFFTTPSNDIIYTYGKRPLKYNKINNTTGNDVYMLQIMLKKINMFPSSYRPNGIYDIYTVNAVKQFQKYYNLTEANGYVLGEACKKTLKYIRDNIYTLKMKNITNYSSGINFFRILYYNEKELMFGKDVQYIQEKLKDSIDSGFIVNGIYDLNTENAVKKFEMLNGLYIDGKIGPLDFSILNTTKFKSLTNPIITSESTSEENIKLLQKALNSYMTKYEIPLEVNGIYDNSTKNKINGIINKMSDSQLIEFGYENVDLNTVNYCSVKLYNYLIDIYLFS